MSSCKYCGVELIGLGCINLCWVMAGDPNPYEAAPSPNTEQVEKK